METRYPGEDFEIDFNLTTPDGSPIIITDLSGIVILICTSNPARILGRFSLNALTDFSDIETVNPATGQIRIKIESGESDEWPHEIFKAEIKITTADGDAEDGELSLIQVVEELFCLSKTYLSKQATS